MTQASFDDHLGAAVLPTLTVWREFNTVCGWCVKPIGQYAGGFSTWDTQDRPLRSNICMPCRDKHGLNAHLDALREGRYRIGSNST